jgi:ParB family chromosome partitioning protein
MQVMELGLDSLDLSYGRLRVTDRRREAQLMASMEEQGQQDAISVVAVDDGRWIVVDGHKRVRALRRLRRDVVKAVVLEMSTAEALAAVYRAGSGPGRGAIEEGWLVYELHRVGKWDLAKTAAALGRSKSWASRRLGLVEELPEAVLEGVRCGKLGAWSATKHLLPLARANGPACEQLAGKIMEASLSSRQVALVCAHFAKSVAKVGERILEDPARFLQVLESMRHKDAGSLGPEELRCLKNLELIGNVSLGLARSLPAIVSSDTATAARERLEPAWERARRRWDELSKTAAAVFMTPARRPASEGGAELCNGKAAAHVG